MRYRLYHECVSCVRIKDHFHSYTTHREFNDRNGLTDLELYPNLSHIYKIVSIQPHTINQIPTFNLYILESLYDGKKCVYNKNGIIFIPDENIPFLRQQ